MRLRRAGEPPWLGLGALVFAALLVHGYHLGTEDAEIYLPGALKASTPSIFSFAPEFFLSHAHLSLFSSIVGWSIRLAHLPSDWVFFGWYLLSLFAMVLSCWWIATACFQSERARWGAVLVTTMLFTMPATNTGLLLMDPYLTARSFSTPLSLCAIAGFLEKKYARMSVAVVLTAAIHPQMVAYLAFLIGVMHLGERGRRRVEEPVPVLASISTGLVGFLPSSFHLTPAQGAYREALYSRDYFFLYNWSWYHWLGMLAPLAILAWFWKSNSRAISPEMRRLCLALIPFGLLSIVAATVLSSSPAMDMFVRLQPLRSFHLITLIFVLLIGGVIGEFAAKGRPWVLAAVSMALAGGMFIVARNTYPFSPQVELPSRTSPNAWINALLWVRNHTPKDAIFAIDARYFEDQGTDMHGFRAIAQRSALADYYKDSGAVSLFPLLATEWKQMSSATMGLDHFTEAEFYELYRQYPMVTWTVVHGPAPAHMVCPYQERGYAVCQLPVAGRTVSRDDERAHPERLDILPSATSAADAQRHVPDRVLSATGE